jgi:ribosomal protein S18 acetylase RimI-like enzyme
VIGYLHAEDQRIPASRYKLGARRLHVIAMTVSAIARRQGVGRAMLAAARAEAIARSASEVTLEVYAFNTPARRLYEAEGFRPIRELLSSAVPAEHSGDPSTRTGRRG